MPRERSGCGVASQVALARQESPHRGQQLLGFAKDLARDLPATRQALREGRLNEYRATLIARETGCLDADDRRQVEAEICDPAVLDGLGNQQLAGEVRRRVAQADPAAVLRRHQKAVSDRAVTVRPAADKMAYLTGFLPLTQAVAAYAALKKTADTMIGTGDNTDPADPTAMPRSPGQLMTDLMVEWLTGQKRADHVPVTVSLVMSDATLLGAGSEPVTIPGYGRVPAQVAREAVARAVDATQAWIRKLYTSAGGDLVALTTQQRLATEGLAAYLAAPRPGHLPHPLVRRPRAPPRPRRTPRARRRHRGRAPPRPLPGPQPRQASHRLATDRHRRPRPLVATPPHRPDPHPDRTHLHQPRARTTRRRPARWPTAHTAPDRRRLPRAVAGGPSSRVTTTGGAVGGRGAPARPAA
ncbi:hypothetical protein GCM10023226_26030 [Nocardioides nanhaiensis]|uniref:DUF222 domain-containing protein n=1 Tax=Nocardioides nanhaiensis TaxID=1476871 RepID=A0ABP8WCZ9_9ACTN